jgi:hypothetical protein
VNSKQYFSRGKRYFTLLRVLPRLSRKARLLSSVTSARPLSPGFCSKHPVSQITLGGASVAALIAAMAPREDQNSLARFYNNSQFSDIIIKYGESRLYAHKTVHAERSAYFARAFLGHFPVCKNTNPGIGLTDMSVGRIKLYHRSGRRR